MNELKNESAEANSKKENETKSETRKVIYILIGFFSLLVVFIAHAIMTNGR